MSNPDLTKFANEAGMALMMEETLVRFLPSKKASCKSDIVLRDSCAANLAAAVLELIRSLSGIPEIR